MWEEPYDSCITLTMLVLVLRPPLDSGLLKAKKGFAFRPVAFLGKGPSLFPFLQKGSSRAVCAAHRSIHAL